MYSKSRCLNYLLFCRFTKASNGDSIHHHLAKYFVDLCLVEYSMAHYRPSEVAAGSLCLSLYLLSSKKLEELWTPTLAYYSQYNLEHLKPIIRKIAKVVVGVGKSKHKAVYKKYLDQRLAKVSALPQLKGDVIYELIQSLSPGLIQCPTVHSSSDCWQALLFEDILTEFCIRFVLGTCSFVLEIVLDVILCDFK